MKRTICTCFALGFVVTFGVLAMLLKMPVMMPGGGAVARMPLWQYYLHEIPRLFEPQVMGPGSPDGMSLLVTALQHTGLALGGGIAVAGLAWLFQVCFRKSV
jgi:hypothetical protein